MSLIAYLQLRQVGIKHRNRCNASLEIIEKNKVEMAELRRKLEETPAAVDPSPAAASELAEKAKVVTQLNAGNRVLYIRH